MNIISLVLKNGSQYLKNNCIKNYQLDAELILGKVLNKSREYLLINDNKVLNEDEVKSYHNLLDRRKKNEPIAYITNEKEFWKSKFFSCIFSISLYLCKGRTFCFGQAPAHFVICHVVMAMAMPCNGNG